MNYLERASVLLTLAEELKAVKEGARRAAEKCDDEKCNTNNRCCANALYDMSKAILTAANNWTEKDL